MAFENVLDPFLQDLRTLETDGITYERPEGDIRFQGRIICVVGDSQGAHAISGLTESFTTFRSCRFCFMPR